MAKSDLPWPKKGDKPYAAEHLTAGKKFMGGFSHYVPSYATSFKEAADIVVNSLEQGTQGSYSTEPRCTAMRSQTLSRYLVITSWLSSGRG